MRTENGFGAEGAGALASAFAATEAGSIVVDMVSIPRRDKVDAFQQVLTCSRQLMEMLVDLRIQ